MSKHTPRPWSERPGSSVRNGGAAYTSVVGPDGLTVARIPIPEAVDRRATAKANGHLVAAAPELLEALLNVLAYESGNPPTSPTGVAIYAAARKAIAKAEKG